MAREQAASVAAAKELQKANAAKRAMTAYRRLTAGHHNVEAPREIDGSIVYVDGIILRHNEVPPVGTDVWHVQGHCPQCRQLDWSGPCYNLADIGQVLQDFHPGTGHHCQGG
jgi:hypothetical protein